MFFRKEADISEKELLGGNAIDFLQRIGLLEPGERIIKVTPVTERLGISGKDFGGGWQRGGAESFIQVLEIITDSGEHALLRKAHHSMGGADTARQKALFEAELLSQLEREGMAPKVRAVLGPMIYRDVVVPDERIPDNAQTQVEALKQAMTDFGYQPLFTSRIEYLFENGRIKLIDGGPGDISKIR